MCSSHISEMFDKGQGLRGRTSKDNILVSSPHIEKVED